MHTTAVIVGALDPARAVTFWAQTWNQGFRWEPGSTQSPRALRDGCRESRRVARPGATASREDRAAVLGASETPQGRPAVTVTREPQPSKQRTRNLTPQCPRPGGPVTPGAPDPALRGPFWERKGKTADTWG